MWTASKQEQANRGFSLDLTRRGAKASGRLTESVNLADCDFVAAGQVGLELFTLVHLLVVACDLLLVLLDVVREYLVPCARPKAG